MADVAVPLAALDGPKVDGSQVTVGANDVVRQRQNISSPTDPAGHAEVKAGAPAAGDYGIVVRHAPVNVDSDFVEVAHAGVLAAVPTIGATDKVYVEGYFFGNGTGAAVTVELTDNAGNHLLPPTLLADGGHILEPGHGIPMIGAKWKASVVGVLGKVWGHK